MVHRAPENTLDITILIMVLLLEELPDFLCWGLSNIIIFPWSISALASCCVEAVCSAITEIKYRYLTYFTAYIYANIYHIYH